MTRPLRTGNPSVLLAADLFNIKFDRSFVLAYAFFFLFSLHSVLGAFFFSYDFVSFSILSFMAFGARHNAENRFPSAVCAKELGHAVAKLTFP